ncbi:hypothetical protein EV356DRAFT_528162 [Viridothelium virens]|uniref:Uncharacterized protein n=1 Tax=Viridothelium virens TaxID=1048519 RepID=A0A6A6HNG1_VIRVR|nr:hypothetical protein EV356DRAFT_528162 [Viridothelium virens]
MKWPALLALVAILLIAHEQIGVFLYSLLAWAYGLRYDDFTSCYLPSAIVHEVDVRCREGNMLGVASMAIQAGKSDQLVGLIVQALGFGDLVKGVVILPWHWLQGNIVFGRGVAVAGSDAFITAMLSLATMVCGLVGNFAMSSWSQLHEGILAIVIVVPGCLFAACEWLVRQLVWFVFSWGTVGMLIKVLLVYLTPVERHEPAPPGRRGRVQRQA